MAGIFWGLGSVNSLGRTTPRPTTDVSASGKAERAMREIEQLEDRVSRLSLICLAMWTLIQDRTNITDEDLAKRVEQLDLADGRRDGKVTFTPRKCPNCQRTMSPRHRRCLYCGTEQADGSAFGTVM